MVLLLLSFYIGIVIVEFYIGIVIVEFYIGIVIVEFYIGIVIVEFYIGIVIVEFYIGIVIVEFLNHYYFFIAYSAGVSYYICLAVLVAIVNAINILTHAFGCNIDLTFSFFLFSELFGTRAYALVQITQKINSKNKSHIAPESMR